MFEFRLRVLDVRERDTDPHSYLGIVEGFPQILVHESSASECEAALSRMLAAFLEGLQDLESTRLELDDFPTVRTAELLLSPRTQ